MNRTFVSYSKNKLMFIVSPVKLRGVWLISTKMLAIQCQYLEMIDENDHIRWFWVNN